MKVSRFPFSKRAKGTPLVQDVISLGKRSKARNSEMPKDGIEWNRKTSSIAWYVAGIDEGYSNVSTYSYVMQTSGDELALLVEAALMGAACDRTGQAQAKAIAAYIREALKANPTQ